MRRVPIACALHEAGEWVAWKPRHCMAPIRLYANGLIEDDIYQRCARTSWIKHTAIVDMKEGIEINFCDIIFRGVAVTNRRNKMRPHELQTIRRKLGV